MPHQGAQPIDLTGVPVMGADYTTNPATLRVLSTDSTGKLIVSGGGGGGSNPAAGPTGSPVPADADYIGFNSGGNLVGVSSVNPLPITGSLVLSGAVNQGNQGTAAQGWFVELTDGTNVLGTSGHPLRVDPTGTTVQPVSNGGTFAVQAAQSGTWTVGISAAQTIAVTNAGTFAVQSAQSGSWTVSVSSVSGTIGVTQSTSPWVVSLVSTTITGTVAVTQSTSPWVVSNSGTFAVQAAQSGTWTVGISAAQTIAVTNAGTFAVQAACTQSTSPWIVAGGGTAGTPGTAVLTVQGIGGGTAIPVSGTVSVSGTVGVTQSTSPWVVSNGGTFAVQSAQSGTWTVGISASQTIAVTNTGTFATQSAITAASGAIASGAFASGSIASGAVASGAIASGAAVSGAFASGAIVDLTNVTSALAATAPTKSLSTSVLAATALPTAVTGGQAIQKMSDKYGRQACVLNTVRDLVGTLILSNNNGSTAQNFGSAGSTGVFLDIITFVVTNRSSTATVVSLADGTKTYTYAIAGNGGMVINFPTPLPASASATQWTVLNSAGVACDYMAVVANNK